MLMKPYLYNLNLNILLRFLSEEDEECLKNELKEAFRIYDKVQIFVYRDLSNQTESIGGQRFHYHKHS